jgi:hypothetical protein
LAAERPIWRRPREGGQIEVARGAKAFLLFPRDDDRFTAVVRSLTTADAAAADQLQPRLRAFYPRAVVRRRDPLGDLDLAPETWYVYRDGSPVSRRRDEEPRPTWSPDRGAEVDYSADGSNA